MNDEHKRRIGRWVTSRPLYMPDMEGMHGTTQHGERIVVVGRALDPARATVLPEGADPKVVETFTPRVGDITFDAVEDTSEEPCTDHGFDVCPDCGNAGVKVGKDGYEPCTRFLTCWSDSQG